ncbi:glycosyltransferase family 2 protein [Chloroflexota bacterium]
MRNDNNMSKPPRYPKITVIICASNEEENLPHVLPRIAKWVDEIILVDANSTDKTVEVAKQLLPELKILYQPVNGKGDALKYGVKNASGDIVVTLDADGQTDPEEITRFIDPLLSGYDFAKGSRLANGRPQAMPWHRWLGNNLIVTTCNILYHTKFTDLCSGYNAFWRESFLEVNPWAKDNWDYEPSIIARGLKGRLKITEVTYKYTARIQGRSKLTDWKQGFMAIAVLISERFRA